MKSYLIPIVFGLQMWCGQTEWRGAWLGASSWSRWWSWGWSASPVRDKGPSRTPRPAPILAVLVWHISNVIDFYVIKFYIKCQNIPSPRKKKPQCSLKIEMFTGTWNVDRYIRCLLVHEMLTGIWDWCWPVHEMFTGTWDVDRYIHIRCWTGTWDVDRYTICWTAQYWVLDRRDTF